MTWPLWARPRLLPITIGVMSLVLVVRVMALVQGHDSPSVIQTAGLAMVPAARAAASEETAPKPAAKATAAAKPESAAPASAPKPNAPPQPATEPPVSDAERALLSDLRARRVTLDERATALDTREAVVAAAERRLSERLEQLSTLQGKLEQLDQTRRERDEANWRSMVKTYETMRPRDAAAIFNELDQPVLLQVLDRMKEAKAAAILAAMQPERARVATTELAKWRTRSPDGEQP